MLPVSTNANTYIGHILTVDTGRIYPLRVSDLLATPRTAPYQRPASCLRESPPATATLCSVGISRECSGSRETVEGSIDSRRSDYRRAWSHPRFAGYLPEAGLPEINGRLRFGPARGDL